LSNDGLFKVWGAAPNFGPAGRSAVSRAKNGRDAVALGRQEAGCFYCLGFSRSENPKPKNGTEAVFGQRKG
jgi:hypothetical protein